MKIALVTTTWSQRSGIADYTRHLLPYLREGADVELFVEVGREGRESNGEVMRSVAELRPRDYDQILYQLGNEAQHAFMLPLIRALGGTVMLHDWVLFDLSMAAHPALQRGGLRGLSWAFREGGAQQARTYLHSRRRASGLEVGRTFRAGWFAAEPGGRWSSAHATLDLSGADALRLRLLLPEGRSLSLRRAGRRIGTWNHAGEVSIEVELESEERALIELDVRGAGSVRHPPAASEDDRELGVFLEAGACLNHGEWIELELNESSFKAAEGMSARRFELALNRSVVRHGDAFLVHSDWVGEQILASRNAATPIARVQHGVERRWQRVEPATSRAQLGLPAEWNDDFLIATFGALQAHKRPQVLLATLQRLEQLGVSARLLCVGEERPAEFEWSNQVAQRNLAHRVHVTGWLPEEQAWQALNVADACVNLRGPSTGGTSGGASQALSLAKPVIISDLPEFAHLPDDCVLRLPQDFDEVERLASLIGELAADSQRCAQMATRAREAVEEELHWSHVAKRYREALGSFPRARAARRSLFVRFLHATAKDKSAPKSKSQSIEGA